MEEQQILNEQKGKQPQSSTITQQTTPQSGRYQTLKQIICTKEQNEESKKNQPIQQIISTNNKFQMNKRENSLQAEGIYITKSYISPEFGQEGVERYQTLKQIICTKEQNEESDHINSGGEADIFTNQNDDNIVYRVIKLNEDKDLRKQEQELQRFQELQEQNILNINSSYLIENQVIIYSMQKCQMSLYDKIHHQKKVFRLRETLKFISTAFHLLIVLRQKYIYHSDIKPGNILKIDDNNYQLSDFGASQQVDFIDPFCDYEMYTPDFKPKKREKNLPFYHDIYSFENQSEISKCLNEFFDEEICKDDENSIKVGRLLQIPKKICKYFNEIYQ